MILERELENTDNKGKLDTDEMILKIAQEKVEEFFVNQFRESDATVKVNEHYEHMKINGKNFENFLRREYFKKTNKTPKQISDAIKLLDAIASAEEKIKINNRVAMGEDGCIYYDLINEKWQCIKIMPNGWDIINIKDAPVLFDRYSHQKKQIIPKKYVDRDRDAKLVLEYVNIEPDSEEALLLLIYIASCFIADIPHPVLFLIGEHGSAKSSLSKIIHRIVDPTITELVDLSDNKKELIQKVSHDWLTIFDNVSRIGKKTSNILCKTATGGSSSNRSLFTNDDDYLREFHSCVAINSTGLENKLADDLLDRSIIIEMERIKSQNRKTEQDMFNNFEEDFHKIFAGFIEVIALAITIIDDLKFDGYPRMADFYKWGSAIAIGFGYKPEEFQKAYYNNTLKAQNANYIDNTLFQTVQKFIGKEKSWRGTATELLEEINNFKDNDEKLFSQYENNIDDWPSSVSAMSRRLNQMERALDNYGISLSRVRTESKREILLKKDKMEINI